MKRGITRNFDTGILQPGKYELSIKGSGDADLYVKVGATATARTYDCRPFKSGSNESCTVDVRTPANVSVMVRGYAATSTFDYAGKKL